MLAVRRIPMGAIMRIAAAFTSIYMILIFIRIMLSWFSAAPQSSTVTILGRITDPYLNWFRRFPALRTGSIDFSPLIAVMVLSFANNIFGTIAHYGRISLGIILALFVSGIWSAIAFILMFLIIVIGLHFAYISMGRQSSFPLWTAVEGISKPVLYRISRWIYRDRLVSYKTGIVTSLAVLLGTRIFGGILVGVLSGLLSRIPF